jgi:RNA polymerase sigma-70 factor, ECF subfamily
MMSEERTTGEQSDQDLADFKNQMVALIPSLRAFARGLCRDREMADDVVQEAMMRAWASRNTFSPGTNFRAWMFQILRNQFYTSIRKNSRMTAWDPEAAERILVQEPTQEAGIHVDDVNTALLQLPSQQREILLLVAGAGLSYEDAAVVAGCSVGTVKSRLNRGRAAIKAIIIGKDADAANESALSM